MTPEDFARSFAAAFSTQDAVALAAMLASEGTFLTLTGIMAQSRAEARHAMAQEFIGIFAQARLVSGKGTIRPLGDTAALLTQRYVVSGALDETGAELPRFAAVLVAVLEAGATGWHAICLTFTAVA